MVALWNRADHYIFILSFVLLSFFFFFFPLLISSSQIGYLPCSYSLRRWTEGATCVQGRPSRWALAHILVVFLFMCANLLYLMFYVLTLGYNLWNLTLLYTTILINLLTSWGVICSQPTLVSSLHLAFDWKTRGRICSILEVVTLCLSVVDLREFLPWSVSAVVMFSNTIWDPDDATRHVDWPRVDEGFFAGRCMFAFIWVSCMPANFNSPVITDCFFLIKNFNCLISAYRLIMLQYIC